MMKTYFHGSYKCLKVGDILKPQGNYQINWGQELFYQVLERHRPSHMLAHHQSVFMCDNAQDVDNAGGATEWLFTVQPLGIVEKHDMAWMSHINIALEENDEVKAREYALNYWYGVESEEPVWEYLTTEALIMQVEQF